MNKMSLAEAYRIIDTVPEDIFNESRKPDNFSKRKSIIIALLRAYARAHEVITSFGTNGTHNLSNCHIDALTIRDAKQFVEKWGSYEAFQRFFKENNCFGGPNNIEDFKVLFKLTED